MVVRTLIVDDSVDFRALLRKRLEQIGCVVVAEAGDSTSALTLFRSHQPKLVTLDLMMPDSSNFTASDLFRVIREESPETPVLLMSSAGRANSSRYLAAGAAAYIEKSFMNFDEVRKILSSLFPAS